MTRWTAIFAIALGCAVAAAPLWPAALAVASVAALAGFLRREDLADARSQRLQSDALATLKLLAEDAASLQKALTALHDDHERTKLQLPRR